MKLQPLLGNEALASGYLLDSVFVRPRRISLGRGLYLHWSLYIFIYGFSTGLMFTSRAARMASVTSRCLEPNVVS